MYFITCFQKISEDKCGVDIGATRTFGYYDKFEYADEALKFNFCDMYEHLYSFAVIEKLEPGIHSIPINRWFYKYDEEKDGFYHIEEPDEFKHCTNFALG